MRRFQLMSSSVFVVLTCVSKLAASSAFSCTTFQYGTAANTVVTGINNSGQIVGWWGNPNEPLQAYTRTADGTTRSLTSPTGSGHFIPAGINNLGQIAGPTFIINPDGSFIEIPPAVAPPGHTYQNQQISGINDKGELAGSILEDYNEPETGINLIFVRNNAGEYSIIDQSPFDDPYPTLIPGAINNAGILVEHTRYTDGSLLAPDGSRTPLLYPGLPVDPGEPGGSSFTAGLNNFNITAGSTTSPAAPNLAYIHNRIDGYQEINCPEAGNATLTVTGLNDRNMVAGDYFGVLPSGVSGQFGFIATPTGSWSHGLVSDKEWSFGTIPIGQTSASGTILLLSLGPADLNIGAVYIGLTGQSTDQTTAFTITYSNCAPVPDGPQSISPLAPGQLCFVQFQFAPKLVGDQTAALYIPTDAHGSPAVVQLSGTGESN